MSKSNLTDEDIAAGMTSKYVPAAAATINKPGEPIVAVERVVITPPSRQKASAEAAQAVGGRQAVVLTADEAKAIHEAQIALEMAEQAAASTDVQNASVTPPTELPVLTFPIKIRISNDGYTGSLIGVSFVAGACDAWIDWRRCMQLAGSGFNVFEQGTDIAVTTYGEGRNYTIDNKYWGYGQALPPHANPSFGAAIIEASKPVQPPKSVNPFEVIKPVVAETLDKNDLIKRAISSLRPGHKDDWTQAGLPDCNRLSYHVDLMVQAAVGPDGERPFNSKVVADERDLAWSEMQRDALDGDRADPNDRYKMPVSNDLKLTIDAAIRNKGAIFVRQKAEEWGVVNPPKESDALIKAMHDAGVTIEQARSMFKAG